MVVRRNWLVKSFFCVVAFAKLQSFYPKRLQTFFCVSGVLKVVVDVL